MDGLEYMSTTAHPPFRPRLFPMRKRRGIVENWFQLPVNYKQTKHIFRFCLDDMDEKLITAMSGFPVLHAPKLIELLKER